MNAQRNCVALLPDLTFTPIINGLHLDANLFFQGFGGHWETGPEMSQQLQQGTVVSLHFLLYL